MFRYFRYWKADPWSGAPPWAVELRRMLEQINRRESYSMAQQEDIKAALAIVRADVEKQTTVVSGLSAYVAGIQKQLVDMANASKDDETASALMALAAQIESNTKSDADAMAANLTGVTEAQAGTVKEPEVTDTADKPVENPFTDEAKPVV